MPQAPKKRSRVFVFAATLFVVAGCQAEPAPLALAAPAAADSTSGESPKYASVLIRGVPHVRQKSDFCGEACAAMYLKKLGKQADQDFVFDQSGLDPVKARGCYTRELYTALWRIGFDARPVWEAVAANDADQLEAQFKALHADLAAERPSIVCMHYSDRPNTTEHFRLVLGYDAKTDEVIYHEPAEDRGAYQRMKRPLFLKLWPLKYDARRWTVVRMPLRPRGELKADIAEQLTGADYAQHIMSLKERLSRVSRDLVAVERRWAEQDKQAYEDWRKAVEKAKKEEKEPPRYVAPDRPSEKLSERKFHIVIEKPFVVVGDDHPNRVEMWATGTVRWAVQNIKRLYFKDDPDHIITIFLFKDKHSYNACARLLFGSRPHTPFGYYSYRNRALVMNISTGGGTLVHEIVHPFVAKNFPDCPSWFNEGLASLYEQCGTENGRIWGYTNWRLRGLQKAIEKDKVPSFKELCGTSTYKFYEEDKGTNYAQARYLCHYLQSRGLLVKFYHEFRKNVKDDPGGYKTLQKVLGEEDMDEFKKKWEKYITELRF